MITDVLHINCLILQKIYSVLLKQSHARVFYIFIPYSAWLSGCEWLSAWDKCNPGYNTALATALDRARDMVLEKTRWKQKFGSCPQISAISALWVPQNSEISGSSHCSQKCQRLQVHCHLCATGLEGN